MELVVNGIQMAFQANGESEPKALLLVHGFPLDSGMWEAQLAGPGGPGIRDCAGPARARPV